jgi:hypothetical protein
LGIMELRTAGEGGGGGGDTAGGRRVGEVRGVRGVKMRNRRVSGGANSGLRTLQVVNRAPGYAGGGDGGIDYLSGYRSGPTPSPTRGYQWCCTKIGDDRSSWSVRRPGARSCAVRSKCWLDGRDQRIPGRDNRIPGWDPHFPRTEQDARWGGSLQRAARPTGDPPPRGCRRKPRGPPPPPSRRCHTPPRTCWPTNLSSTAAYQPAAPSNRASPASRSTSRMSRLAPSTRTSR